MIKQYELNIAKKQGKIKVRSKYSKRIKFMSKEELEKFFSVIDRLKYRAVFSTILEFGLRGQECSLLDLEDIDWKQRTIYIYRLKNGNSETYKMSPSLQKRLKNYVKNDRQKTDSQALFTTVRGRLSVKTIQHWFYHYARKAFGKNCKFHLHCLRHSAAVLALKSGLNVFEVKDLLGHRSIDNTAIYLHIVSKDRERYLEKRLKSEEYPKI